MLIAPPLTEPIREFVSPSQEVRYDARFWLSLPGNSSVTLLANHSVSDDDLDWPDVRIMEWRIDYVKDGMLRRLELSLQDGTVHASSQLGSGRSSDDVLAPIDVKNAFMAWWSEQGLPVGPDNNAATAEAVWDVIELFDDKPVMDFHANAFVNPPPGMRVLTSGYGIKEWRPIELPDWLFGLFWLAIWLLGISTIRRVMFKHR